MQGAMPWMFISTGQACSGGSGTSKALSNSICGKPTRYDDAALLGGGVRHAAMGLRPAGRIVQEFLDLLQLDRVELAAALGEVEHVPPGAEVMHLDAEIGQD